MLFLKNYLIQNLFLISCMKNKFQIGISPFLDLKDYKIIYNKYKKKIFSIYFSLFLEGEKQTRSFLNKKKFNIKKYFKILKYFSKKNIDLELIINSGELMKENQILLIKSTLKKNRININSLVITENNFEICKKYFNNIKINCSYNNNIRKINKENLLKYDNIILGNNNIRNINTNFKNIYFLINNGCSFNCNWCVNRKGKNCFEVFKKNLEKFDINFLYAFQSIFPNELKKYNEKKYNNFKLSTRTCNKKEMFKILEIYLEKKTIKNKKDLFYCCKLSHFYSKENFKKLNVKKINNFKKEIKWNLF